jgi:hypothetical protein
MKIRTSGMRGFALMALGALAFTACDSKDTIQPIPTPEITVTVVPASATLAVGQSQDFAAIVSNATDASVAWSSSNQAVATVDANGRVTAVSPGSVIIRATSNQDATKFGASSVVVTPSTGTVDMQLVPSTASVVVGGTVQLVSVVTGTSNTAVTYASSTPAVATVDASGLVTGVAQGTAVITSTSQADPTVIRTATITVTPAAPPPSISIQNVTPVGANNVVSGTITATINVSADVTHDVRRVEVRLGGQVVCAQTFTQPLGTTQGVATITCNIDTMALDEAGVPLFQNGTVELTAVAINGAGEVVAEASFGNVNIQNTNTVILDITTVGVADDGEAIGSDGLLWREGNVVVTARPALFTGGTATSVTVCLDIPAGATDATAGAATGQPCRTITTADNNAFVATFPKANAIGAAAPGVAGVSNSNVRAYVSATALSTGQPGPTAPLAAGSPSIRLDNLAPDAPTTVDWTGGEWLGAGFNFNRANVTTHNAAALEALDPQPGVGGVTLTFHVFEGTEAEYTALGANAAARMAAVVSGGTQVTSTADLDASDTDTHYILVVRAEDALGNGVNVRVLGAFGVDVVAPQFNIVEHRLTGSPANMTINPATDFQFDFPFVAGNVSGTILNPEVRIVRWTSNPASTRCVNVNTGVDTALPTGGASACAFVVAAGLTVPVPAADGYYELTFRFRDNAGNLSATETRLVLRDVTPPVVTLSPDFALAGNAISIGATITDNIDLRSWDTRLRFGGLAAPTGASSNALPTGAPTVVGSFGTTRVASVTASATVTLWRSLSTTDGAGDLAGGATGNLDGAGFGAFDIARNFSESFMGAGQTFLAVPAGLDNVNISLSGTSFCNGITPAPSGDQGFNCSTPTPQPASRTVTVTASGPTGFVNPFTAVHVYRVDVRGNVQYVGQAAFTASGSVGTRFEHRWTLTANATGWRGDAEGIADGAVTQQIFAVGVSADRDAFRSPTVAITVRGAHRQPQD